MYLRDLAIYADETIVSRFPSGFVGWFHRETCCITEMYRNLLGKNVATPDTAKVNLTFTDTAQRAPVLRQFIDVVDAIWLFSFAEYLERTEREKKRMILDGLHSALVWIASQRGWDENGLRTCHDEVVRRNLTCSSWSRKSWTNPKWRCRARVGFSWGLRSVDFYVGVFDMRGRELGRKPLRSIAPEMGVAHSVLKGIGTWRDDGVFSLDISSSSLWIPGPLEADVSALVSGREKGPG